MNAEISISRTQSNRRDAFVTIQVVEQGLQGYSRRITVTLEVEAFGQALLGLAGQRCAVEVKDFRRERPKERV